MFFGCSSGHGVTSWPHHDYEGTQCRTHTGLQEGAALRRRSSCWCHQIGRCAESCHLRFSSASVPLMPLTDNRAEASLPPRAPSSLCFCLSRRSPRVSCLAVARAKEGWVNSFCEEDNTHLQATNRIQTRKFVENSRQLLNKSNSNM